MRKCALAVAVSAALIPGVAMSAKGSGAIDVYYVPSADIEVDIDGIGEFEDDGDGFGVKGRFDVAPQFFIAGEYQAVEYDDSNGELDQIRGGLGYRFNRRSPFYLLGEIINIDDGEDDETGFGVHLGVDAAVAPALNLYGQVGYVDVEGDGIEFLGGLAYMFTQQIGGFVDYRQTNLDDNDVEITLDDLRLGIRIALR